MINLQLKLFSKDPIISQYVLLFDKVWFEVQKDEARGNKATLISAIASMECCSHGTLADVADKIDLLLKNVQDPAVRSKILRWFQSSYLVLADGAIRGTLWDNLKFPPLRLEKTNHVSSCRRSSVGSGKAPVGNWNDWYCPSRSQVEQLPPLGVEQ